MVCSAMVNLTVVADDLSDLSTAVDSAKAADVAIVFAGVYTSEGQDKTDLSLANKQDAWLRRSPRQIRGWCWS